jgi:cysteine desulfurase/selenocysteine lyase
MEEGAARFLGREAHRRPTDWERLRRDFPILARTVHGKPLAYLDNASTTPKPRMVIEAIVRHYAEENANVHRGVHRLSELATLAYERARESVRRFLNAQSADEIVFVRGTTEAINLVAASFARPRLRAGDEIVVSELEHHSNIVPWQLATEATGAVVRAAPIDERGAIDLGRLEALLGERTRLIAVAHVSNALGTVCPVERIVRAGHSRGIPVLIDGAQAAGHLALDVRALDCDFYAFSGHKAFGPTGIGVLYGKGSLLAAMPPYQGGGDMIRRVTFAKTEYAAPPRRFEAGTPDIAGAVGLGAALDYLDAIGLGTVALRERELLARATERVSSLPGVRLVGTAADKVAILSFVVEGLHAHDLATVLDREGIAIRAGHHCAMPAMERFGIPGTARASFAFYNTEEEIDRLVAAIAAAQRLFDV